MQQLAFLDACVVAEEPHGAAWRRRQVFQDDSGQTWRAVALPCWREVRCYAHHGVEIAQYTELQPASAGSELLILSAPSPTSHAGLWQRLVLTSDASVFCLGSA